MDKPMTFNEWMGKQGNLALVHANCCRIAYEAGQQSQQAKVEELQTQLSLQRQRVKAFEEELTSSRNYGDELQEEFAEDERFLKEQIQQKDLKISNLEYQQGMDKELIQSLQSKSDKLQKRVDKAIDAINEHYDSDGMSGLYFSDLKEILDGEQALKGNCDQESDAQEITGSYPMPNPKHYEAILKALLKALKGEG